MIATDLRKQALDAVSRAIQQINVTANLGCANLDFFSTFVSLIPVNLNHYRGTVGVFNNHNIAICNFCNIWYSQSF